MSWGFQVTGAAQKVSDSLDQFYAYPEEDAEAQEQIDRAKKLIREEIGMITAAETKKALASQNPSDAGLPPNLPPIFVAVQANGHSDSYGSSTVSIQVSRLSLLV